MPFFTPQSIHHYHLNHSTYYSNSFLHLYIHTLHLYIPEDDTFYPVCIQRQPLAQLLRCSKCGMERLDYENSS